MYSSLVAVPARRHPMQVLMAGLLTLSGVGILAGGPPPNSVSAVLPAAMVYVWAAILTVGGALVVAAALVGPLAALYLEVAADLPLCLGCYAYSTAIWIVAGSRAATVSAMITGVAIAFGVRFWQVLKTLRLLSSELRRRSR
mgnify:CR=1 FL=1